MDALETMTNSEDSEVYDMRKTGLPGDRLPMLKAMIANLGRPLRILETHSSGYEPPS